MLSSRNFRVWILFLGPVIHLALFFFFFFVFFLRFRARFTFRFFFLWGEGVRKSSCYSTICWRDYLCSIVLPLRLVRSVVYIYVGLFLGSWFYYIDLCICFFTCDILSSFKFWIQVTSVLQYCFLFFFFFSPSLLNCLS